ncbi:MAG: hypothetical protein IT285_11945 [Bdellovibrionales bacterium]|nr:hypothetical protein [Bdellovibrionales bacterium]
MGDRIFGFLKFTGATVVLSALLLGVGAVDPTVALAASWSSTPSWATAQSNASRRGRPSSSPYSDSDRPSAPFTPGSNNLALHVGQVFLMGELADHYTDSIGTQLHYTYGVSDMFGFNASLGFSDHSDGEYSVATMLAGLRTNLSWYDKVVPYLVFGLGFYKPSYKLTADNSMSPVLFGLHLGPGVDLQLTDQFFFGAALTFHDVFGTTRTDSKGNLRDVGGTFTSFLLHAGVSF